MKSFALMQEERLCPPGEDRALSSLGELGLLMCGSFSGRLNHPHIERR
jgi:hypothetical protein